MRSYSALVDVRTGEIADDSGRRVLCGVSVTSWRKEVTRLGLRRTGNSKDKWCDLGHVISTSEVTSNIVGFVAHQSLYRRTIRKHGSLQRPVLVFILYRGHDQAFRSFVHVFEQVQNLPP